MEKAGETMGQKAGKKIFYEGTSLDEFLARKNALEQKGIPYETKTKSGDSWMRFFVMSFFRDRSTYGMNGEHQLQYTIYVEEKDWEKIGKDAPSK